jgi:alpha-1,6-mannosyltransferase
MERPARPGARADLPVVAAVCGVAFIGLVASIQGSPLQPVAPSGYQPLAPFRFAARVAGLDALGTTAQAAVAIVAMVVGAVTFLYALRAAWRGELGVRFVAWIGVAFVAFAVLLPLLFSRDVYAYAMYGRIASLHHANPYVSTPRDFASDPLYRLVGPQWHDTTAVYGPGFNLLSSVLTRLLRGPVALVWAYKAIAGAAAVATILLVARLSRRLWPARAAFATALVAWNPIVLFHGVGGGHNDLLIGLAVAAALTLLAEVGPASLGREVGATAVLTLGMLVKATAAIPLVLLVAVSVWRRPSSERTRTLAIHVVVVIGLALALAAPFFQAHDPTFGLASLASHEGWLAPTRFFRVLLGHVGHAVAGSAGQTAVQDAVRVTLPLLFLVAFAAIVRYAVREAPGLDARRQGAAWGWALLVATLAAPVLWPWYLVWTLPVVWLLPRTARGTAVLASAVLVVSETVAAAERFPSIFEGTLFVGHYVLTPILIVAFALVLRELRGRLGDGLGLDRELAGVKEEHREVTAAGHER